MFKNEQLICLSENQLLLTCCFSKCISTINYMPAHDDFIRKTGIATRFFIYLKKKCTPQIYGYDETLFTKQLTFAECIRESILWKLN